MSNKAKNITSVATPNDYKVLFDLGEHEAAMRILGMDPNESRVFAHYCDPKLLPHLSFKDEEFDLALVPHYFFSENGAQAQQKPDEIIAAIQELLRVANEARIAPLMTSTGEPPSDLGDIIAQAQQLGLGVEIRSVGEGNAMLRIWSPTCTVK